MDQMIRIMVFDHQGTYISDIDPTQVLDMTYVEEVNGEHSLTITTFQTLSKTDRLLIRDGMGVWREFVVLGTNESHTGLYVTNEYYCTWSLQYDLMATFVNNLTGCGYVPGHESVPKAATVAMGVALEGTDRWTVGTVTVPTLSSSSFYRRSGWEALQTVVEKWGGEVQATITVSTNGVVSRAVDLLTHVGTSEATRRFDYGHDITSIKRTVSDDVWPCRIVPLGKSMETENGGYTRRPDISSVNGGVMWLQNDAVVPYTRIPDGSGGWEYPTIIIMNESYEEPADVKAWGLENLTELTSPKVTYEANVAQFVRAGLDPHGVALGDNIVVVDRTFGSDGLRLTARVTKITGNLLDASQTKLTIGNIGTSISRQLAGVSREVARLSGDVENASAYQATSEYMDALLGRINQEVNATGGYTYITQGEGIRTYDVPVSDPLVGDEASKVVEVKGGNIRIANSRTQAGDWDWKTVIQSGHIASELVTTAQLVAGYIGNATNGNFWNLDTGAFRLGNTATIGDRTVEQALQDIDANITSVDVQYAQNQSPTVAPTSGWSTTAPAYQAGYYIWQRTATTTPTGTSYSTPVMISGRDGQDGADGTSVTILGSYATYADLIADHPTGSVGDGYLVAGDLYVWDGTQWLDVGTIQGPQGPAGTNGTDGADGSQIWTATAAPTTPNYTFALSSLTGPAGVSPQVGDIIVYSYYRYTISSVGTDSVRSGSRTSIRGAAGSNGTNGTNGINAYVHIAWANSADGSADFSTTVSAGKQYLGTYADSTQADSQDYHDYSWSLIKGADGTDGTDGTDGSDGVGIASIVEQYYLSTSSSTQSGGSWSTNQPTWESGKYIWTRSYITWDDGTTATTTPTLAQAINSANQTAASALDTASGVASDLALLETQEAIFNLLTENGTLQGLYMDDGDLYINASYILSGYISANRIHGGTLLLGGSNNDNGLLQLLDADGNVISSMDNTGASITGDVSMQTTYIVTPGLQTSEYTEITRNSYYPAYGTDQIYQLTGLTRGSGDTVNVGGLRCMSYQTSRGPNTAKSTYVIPNAGYWSTIYSDSSAIHITTKDGYYTYLSVDGDNIEINSKNGAARVRINGNETDRIFVNTSARLTGTVTAANLTATSAITGKTLSISSTKSRIADTDNYGNRLLYCYETPAPLFGDIGSGTIDSDGTCIVSVDDIFSETARTDRAYQVFLQKCGAGDLWVAEKCPGYFIVEGTPGLPFDWELKAHQAGYEATRLEDYDLDRSMDDDGAFEADEIERIQEDEARIVIGAIAGAYDELGAA